MQNEDLSTVYQYLFPKLIYKNNVTTAPQLQNLVGEQVSRITMLFLLRNALNHEISSADMEMLRKMADWSGIDRKEVAVHLLTDAGISFHDLRKRYHLKFIVGFGIHPADINLNLDYRINHAMSFMQCMMLFTAPFAEVQREGTPKKDFFAEATVIFSKIKRQK